MGHIFDYISMKLLLSARVKECYEPVAQKVKQIFQTKKNFVTCSKLIINELGLFQTRPDNV